MGLNIPPSDQNIQLSDIVTANATIARHGFLKKLSNVATEYMDGSGNFSTPAGGTPTSGSAYTIIGGSAVATTNGTSLQSAYTAAKLATPQGAALATGNRYTIFLLPGVYDLGAGTLTLDANFIDIVGISTDTGVLWREPGGTNLTQEGDTVISSTGTVINLNDAGVAHDVSIENVCLKRVTAGSGSVIDTTQTVFGPKLKVVNVLIRLTGGGNRPMPVDKGVSGTWIDVRHFDGGFMFGASFGTVITVDGFFLRCKCVTGFGAAFIGNTTLSGTFIDCEADSSAWGANGDATRVATLSGTFIRCRHVNIAGGAGPMFGGTTGILSGTFIDCHAVNSAWGATLSGSIRGCSGSGPGWTSVTGTVLDNDFVGWKGILPVNTADSTTISNTVAETNFSLNQSIATTYWKVARAFRWEAWGKFSTDAVTPGTLTIRSKFGATVLRTTGARTLLGGATNAGWRASGIFVLRTTGATGTVSTQLKLEFDAAGFIGDSITPSNGVVTINTTIANTFQLSAEWSVADTDNSITLENFIVVPEAGN